MSKIGQTVAIADDAADFFPSFAGDLLTVIDVRRAGSEYVYRVARIEAVNGRIVLGASIEVYADDIRAA